MKDDSKMREKLAKLVGLDTVPEIDPKAMEKLDGLFDDLIDGPIDCVQLIKEARIRDYHVSKQMQSSSRSNGSETQ